ncbi:cell division protein FtsL [Metabacillus fastidiosus]|uniref:cell division protein FtsL n=1 Tax=Metabacillus fastidiosus TaxID=1458 RepID=UPI003D2E197C
MSNLATKIQEVRQEKLRQAPVQQTVIVKRRATITLGEKVLLIVFALFLLIGAINIIANSFKTYQTNVEIQKMEKDIQTQKQVNNDLHVQVEELSKPERIWEKAKELGLKLDENKVRNVQD